MPIEETSDVSHQATRQKEQVDGHVKEFESSQVGMKIPHSFHPQGRRKALYGRLRRHLMLDHVHMMISIPPKYSVSPVIGYIKGKSAIHIARHYGGRVLHYTGQHFWARGVLRLDGVSRRRGDKAVKKKRTRGWSNSNCGNEGEDHPKVMLEGGVALATPD